MHDPDQADKAAEARRLGGARRRHESTLGVVYDLPALDTIAGIRRMLEIVTIDTLGLDAGIGRLRVQIAAIGMAIKLHEASDVERRLEALEALARRNGPPLPPSENEGGLLDGGSS